MGERHGGDGGDGVGLKEVGGHAGAIAYVVPHIIGDHGGISRIVFRDTGFHLSDQIGPHIRRLGVDAAADPSEKGD